MKNIITFMVIGICCISLGIFSYSVGFFDAFENSMTLVDDVSSFFATPLNGVFKILGISKSNDSQFATSFYIRSTLDNQLIPKDNPYYDELYYAVVFEKENFLTRAFNDRFTTLPPEHHIPLVLFFSTDGRFLFGMLKNSYFSPFIDQKYSFSITEWHNMFLGTYMDIEKEICYVNAPGLRFDTEFKFHNSGFHIGIWQ